MRQLILLLTLVVAAFASAQVRPGSDHPVVPPAFESDPAGSQHALHTTAGDDGFFAAWLDIRGSFRRLLGTRIDRNGVALDPHGMDLAPGIAILSVSGVLWNGRDYVILFYGDPPNAGVWSVVVGSGGTRRHGPQRLPLTSGVTAAANDRGEIMLFTHGRAVEAYFLHRDGTLAAGKLQLPAPSDGSYDVQDAAGFGNDWALVLSASFTGNPTVWWRVTREGVAAQRFLEDEPRVALASNGREMAIVQTLTDYLFNGSWRITLRYIVVNENGSLLEGRDLSTNTYFTASNSILPPQPAVTWNGSTFVFGYAGSESLPVRNQFSIATTAARGADLRPLSVPRTVYALDLAHGVRTLATWIEGDGSFTTLRGRVFDTPGDFTVVDAKRLLSAPAEQSEVRAASNARGDLVVFTENRETTEIRTAFVATNGTISSSELLGQGTWPVDVDATPSGFVVARVDERRRVLLDRFDVNGRRVANEPILVESLAHGPVAVTADGTRTAIAYYDNRLDLYVTTMRNDGTFGTPQLVLMHTPNVEFHPRVRILEPGDGTLLLVWSELGRLEPDNPFTHHRIHMTRINANGTLGTRTMLVSRPGIATVIDAAVNGDEILLAASWVERKEKCVIAQRFSLSGVPRDAEAKLTCSEESFGLTLHPSVAWSGSQWLVATNNNREQTAPLFALSAGTWTRIADLADPASAPGEPRLAGLPGRLNAYYSRLGEDLVRRLYVRALHPSPARRRAAGH